MRQGLDTRDELGFGDEMVMVKILIDMSAPAIRGVLVMTMTSISPSWREVSPAELLRWRAKVLPPRFRLETSVLHLESLLIASRLNGFI